MTAATREPEDEELDPVRWNDRALFGNFRGLPWWVAVLGTFVLAIVGTYVDVSSQAKTVGWVFGITFFVGAVGAVVFVERRSMFGPVVQPPLVLAIVVPLVLIVTAGVPEGGLPAIGLNLGKPLIDGFPAMALTTACTVVIGILRVSLQKDPNRPTKDEAREAKRVPAEDNPEDRPKRPRERAPRTPAADRTPKERSDRAPKERSRDPEDRPRRRPAPAEDEQRPKRPRPQGERRRPQDPNRGGRPPQRRPRPRDDD